MKSRPAPLKRILAILLILATFGSALVACKADNENITESDTDIATDVATDENGGEADVLDGNADNIESDDSIIPIFANGAYSAKLIRSENATAIEKELASQIKDLLKKLTGVNPELVTDYTASGTEKYNGPAILIGETNYTESKKAYKALNAGEASATLSGNKYVIAATSDDSATKLVSGFKTALNKNATKDSITIDSKWKLSVKGTADATTGGNETFNESGLPKSATLPNLGTGYGSGQGSKTYIKSNADKAAFNTLCKDIEAKGFKKYTTNTIGSNQFATYVTQTQIVHVMFFPNKSQIRTAVDKRGTGTAGFALPGLSGENKYTKKTTNSLTLCEIENADWPGGLCMIFKLADGRFFVVDSGIGGRKDNGGSSCGWVYASLAKHADDPKNIQVAAWLITHVHSDHAGGLLDIARGWYQKSGSSTKHKSMPQEAKQWIKIDKIIYNAPDNLPDSDREGWMTEIINAFSIKKVIKAHPGQVLYLSDLTLTIYASQDLIVEKNGSINNTNEHSIVARAVFNGKSIMMLGDTFPKVNAEIGTIYKESLKSDILQVSHHGYNNTSAATVNKYCNPSIVLYPVSTGDMRRENVLNVAVNAPLKGKTLYAPHGGNVYFDQNWKKSMISNATILNAIPKCPCCGKRSSYSPKYDANCPCGCQK